MTDCSPGDVRRVSRLLRRSQLVHRSRCLFRFDDEASLEDLKDFLHADDARSHSVWESLPRILEDP